MNKRNIYFLLTGVFLGLLFLGILLNKQTGLTQNTVIADEFKSESVQSQTVPFSLLTDYIIITETPIPTPTFTPTPKPIVTPTPSRRFTSTQFDEWFTRFASESSVDRSLLVKIAVCESGLNTSAVNGIYGGLFQFSSSAWISTRRQMNADTNPELRFNPEQAIRTAAFKIAAGGRGAWPNCGK